MRDAPAQIDVDAVRVTAERDAFTRLERSEIAARISYHPQDRVAARRELLSTSLLLSETMAPHAHSAARTAAQRLGVTGIVELYQSSRGRASGNARLAIHGDPIGIELIGDYLDTLDEGELLAVIGHEIGHSIAHVNHPQFAWVWAVSSGAGSGARRAYALASELTADRFGLLACRDLNAALRVEMRGAIGTSQSIQLDTTSYLDQCRAVAEETMQSGGVIHGWSHPEHYMRGYAEWLFSETTYYKELTGQGNGARTLREVDEIISKLLGDLGDLRVVTASPPAKQLSKTALSASVGDPYVDPSPKPLLATQSLEDLATDILADGARRKIAAAGNVVANAARTFAPSVFGSRAEKTKRASPENDALDCDPLEDDRRALEARFEALERDAKDE